MLIGPTITLTELEEHLIEAKGDVKRKLSEARNALKSLADESSELNPYIYENGIRKKNERYYELRSEFETLSFKFDEKEEKLNFMNEKIKELETIEEESQGQINKEKKRITLTLKECILIGLETDKHDQQRRQPSK